MYQPQSLVTLSRKVVNVVTRRRTYLLMHDLPHCLLNECHTYYLSDNMETNDYKPDVRLVEYVDNYNFSNYHITVSTDIFLTLMHWKSDIPEFAYEWNVVTLRYYEVLDDVYEMKRCCPHCVHQLMKPYQAVWTVFECHGSELMEDCIQEKRHWCEYCYTTTLFKIREGVNAKRMKYSICYEGDIESDVSE